MLGAKSAVPNQSADAVNQASSQNINFRSTKEKIKQKKCKSSYLLAPHISNNLNKVLHDKASYTRKM